MSHISKATIKVAMTNKNTLITALSKIGTVYANTHIYRHMGGSSYPKSSETYDIVLESLENKNHRIGFSLNSDGNYQMHYDDYGALGKWIKNVEDSVYDRYIAHHYEAQLKQEGYDVKVIANEQGELEVEANEMAW